MKRLNKHRLEIEPGETELSARVETFELAYRMQMAAPEAIDIAKETATTHALYGIDDKKCTHFAKQCLIARRLVERGVRYVQIYSGGMENELSWDGHQNIVKNHAGFANETDRPIAGLLTDLAARGLLETRWWFGGDPADCSGRRRTGRGQPACLTVWMAGGRKAACTTGRVGHKAVVDRVSVHDLHATILHLLGMDHKRLTYRFNGRDFRLTDVFGNVVKEVLA